MSYDPVKLQTNKLLLCEGKEEKAVVAQMIEEGLVQKVDVLALGDAKDPAEDKNAPVGIGSLAANLEGVSAMTGFRNIKSIGLLLDNVATRRQHLQVLNQSWKRQTETKISPTYTI